MERSAIHEDVESDFVEPSRDEEALAGLEQHAAHEDGEHETAAEAPGVSQAALAESAEHGAQGAPAEHGVQGVEAPANAVTAISDKISRSRTRMRNKQETQRAKVQKSRIANRARGAHWTAAALANILNTQGAQGVVIQLNTHRTAEGIQVLKTANQWDALLAALPQGKLNAACRRALNQMVVDGLLDLADCKKLFLIRFGINAADATTTWNLPVMQTTWRQLDVLPQQDVTLNTAITTINAITSAGGSYSDSTTSVDLGQDIAGDHEYLENTVRHEIGHGVHAQIKAQVDPWLENDMQFWPTTDFQTWINELGGFPASFTNSTGAVVAMDAAWQTAVTQMVESFTGFGSWNPAKATPDAGEHPDLMAAWAAMPATVKNACAQSTPNWFANYQNFQAKGGKHYFLNHWYHKPFAIGAPAFKTIPATNDMYAAMSEAEFFATCYAEYFRDPTGIKDPANWGGNLNGSVKAFFSDVVVKRHPYAAFQAKQAKKKA